MPQSVVTKRRTQVQYDQQYVQKSAPLNPPVTGYVKSTLSQKTASKGNNYQALGKSNADIGGSFITQIDECLTQPVFASIVQRPRGSDTASRFFKGPIVAQDESYTGSPLNFLAPSSNSALNAYGATGVARSLPTNPLAGMGQFLGEIRDLPKVFGLSLWKSRAEGFRQLARGGADEYLNVQFGWIPFVSDIIKFMEVTSSAENAMKKYARESGRTLHRGSTVFESSSTTVSSSSNSSPKPSMNGYLRGTGKLTTTTVTHTKVWFRGAFTYYLPPSNTPEGLARRRSAILRKMYGLTVTPELLWQLSPWSWAVDWVTNVGDNIHNFNAFQNDGLVMRYGYLMENKSIITTHSLDSIRWPVNDVAYIYDVNAPNSLIQTYRRETKSRHRATPYGFGLDPGTFSARQWSIIAALGISRLPRALNN